MSVELGKPNWSFVGIVDGFALLTHWIDQRSRWVDLRAWPAKLLPLRDEWTRAVCAGATLAGWKQQRVFTWTAPDKRRTEIELPTKRHGYRAIGVLGGRVTVVPGFLGWQNHSSPLACAKLPLRFDGDWKPLDGEGGDETTLAAIVGDLVVWGGRVFRYDGALNPTDAGDLPRAHSSSSRSFVPVEDGFITAAGSKLVFVSRHGKQREDRRVGKLEVTSVARYEGKLLVGERFQYSLYDEDTRTARPLDLGIHAERPTLIAAPCGLVALVDQDRTLVRLRV
jgi:hypothetical protein